MGEDDPVPSSRSSLMRKVALHWSKWDEHGYARSALNISTPSQYLSDADVEEYWSGWRAVILQSLADRSLVRVLPMARNWADSGVYALSALALRLGDFQVWIALFEGVRPWPDTYGGFGHELTPLRDALERDRALLHRFTCRILSADTGDEWMAVVQVFYLTLRSSRTILLADVECLRALWERTKRHEFAEKQLVICLRLALERLGDLPRAAREPLRSLIDPLLADVPRRLLDRRLLSYKLREFLRDLCEFVATSELTRDCGHRADWRRLREWLDEYDECPCGLQT